MSRLAVRFSIPVPVCLVFGPASPTVSNARTSSPGWVGIVPMVGMMLRARELDGQVAGRDSPIFSPAANVTAEPSSSCA